MCIRDRCGCVCVCFPGWEVLDDDKAPPPLNTPSGTTGPRRGGLVSRFLTSAVYSEVKKHCNLLTGWCHFLSTLHNHCKAETLTKRKYFSRTNLNNWLCKDMDRKTMSNKPRNATSLAQTTYIHHQTGFSIGKILLCGSECVSRGKRISSIRQRPKKYR